MREKRCWERLRERGSRNERELRSSWERSLYLCMASALVSVSLVIEHVVGKSPSPRDTDKDEKEGMKEVEQVEEEINGFGKRY